MKNFILTVLLIILVWEIFTLFTLNQKKDGKVLAEKTVPVPIPTLTPKPVDTFTPIATPTLISTPVPTPTPIPQPLFTSEQINGFIDRFSSQYGVDPNVMRHIAICESGFNPFAYKAGYAGLFQFGPITWESFRVQLGKNPNVDLRYNAQEAVETTAFALSKGKTGIWPNCKP